MIIKVFHFLCFLCFLLQEIQSFNWNSTYMKDGSIIYACSNTDVHFPYLFKLANNEVIDLMSWKYHDKQGTKSIGSMYLEEFLTTREYFFRVNQKSDGNFTLKKVTPKDSGDYILKIETKKGKGSKAVPHSEMFSLVVAEKLMFTGSYLAAELSYMAEWNPLTEAFSLNLMCGNFIFKNYNAPSVVEWVLPDGTVKTSTKYKNGRFFLRLANPIKGGKYICRIKKSAKASICAKSSTDTQSVVEVSENKAQFILLFNENERLKKEIKNMNEGILTTVNVNFKQCKDWDETISGRRKIYLPNKKIVEVYCDQKNDGGNWNVFQRRKDGSEDFDREWIDYRNGFGDADGEFWLGLEALYQMTKDGQNYQLRFDLETENGMKKYAVYENFKIKSESEGYAIHISGYKGNAGDSFSQHNDLKFSTYNTNQYTMDKDHLTAECAFNKHSGGWWIKGCHQVNLNGYYNDKSNHGINWKGLTGLDKSLKMTEMKFRKKQ